MKIKMRAGGKLRTLMQNELRVLGERSFSSAVFQFPSVEHRTGTRIDMSRDFVEDVVFHRCQWT